MVNLNSVYTKEEDKWVSRFIWDEVVIMPLCRSEEDMLYIYSISNEIGSRIWQLLDGKHSVGDIQEILKAEYEGQSEVIEREVLEFIGDLVEVKLIQKANNGTKRKNQYRVSSIQHPDKRKSYKTPEIAKVKMQPEQAVLSCCLNQSGPKSATVTENICKATCQAMSDDCGGVELPIWEDSLHAGST